MKSKSIGAAELMAKLNDDVEFQKKKAKKEAERKKACELAAKEEADLVKELNSAGCNISSVWDLVNSAEKYPHAISVLKKHLDINYSKGLKEGIYRALTVNWLSDAEIVEKLFVFFRQEKDDNLRWVIGNTLSVISKTSSDAEKALSLIENSEYGQSRSELVTAYANIFKQDAIPKLIDFLQDKELRVIAINALGKLKAIEAHSVIKKYTMSEDAWVKQHAKKALKKIDKALG